LRCFMAWASPPTAAVAAAAAGNEEPLWDGCKCVAPPIRRVRLGCVTNVLQLGLPACPVHRAPTTAYIPLMHPTPSPHSVPCRCDWLGSPPLDCPHCEL
jgi:hypothetical protein